ncbi:hypothetical protein RND71_004623 [Anisodus tanguticus]|uniref:MORF/ORRM1/DAG-like MORF domain-containing protein n=1 Tax=Anisodus tanguticus TaxID=243964 RepID=A0AAE1VRJ1_9SOLA|nr:hypothetical protein RND71_004623 [Anisodus tanguticus]
MATRYLTRSLLTTLTRSSTTRLRPLTSVAADLQNFSDPLPTTAAAFSVRGFATRQTSSSLSDPNPNWSNRPPKETILLDGCDFEHWLVVMEKPEGDPTRDEIIDSYIKTLANIVGSEEEAQMKIYSVSTRHYYAFGALVSEELSYKLKELPKVRWVLPDSYLDVKNKDYGGEPFINGQAVPYDPKYHEEWVRNNARANERNRRNDRPRNFDRSRNFERREMQNQPSQNPGPNMGAGGPPSMRNAPPPNMGGMHQQQGMGGPPNTGGMHQQQGMGGPPNVGGMHQPDMGGPPRGGGMHQPGMGGPPNMGGMHQPDMGGPPRGGGMHQPGMGRPPNMGGMHQPDMGGPPRGGGMHQPGMGGPPNMGGMHQPDMGGPPRGGGMHQPGMGGPPRGGGMQQPNMPPNMGGAPPNMGGVPPHNYGVPNNAPNFQYNGGPNSGGTPYQTGPGPNQNYAPNTSDGNSYQNHNMPGRDAPS